MQPSIASVNGAPLCKTKYFGEIKNKTAIKLTTVVQSQPHLQVSVQLTHLPCPRYSCLTENDHRLDEVHCLPLMTAASDDLVTAAMACC